MWMNAASYFTAFLVGAYTLLKFLPSEVKSSVPEYHSRLWLKSAFTFSLLGILYTVGPELRVLMLGSLGSTDDVGLFSVAMRGAELISLPLMVLNGVLAPIFASLYKQKDMTKLQNIVTKSAQAILIISTPLTVLLLIYGDWFLSLFGSDFKDADRILAILCIGTLFNALTGSVGLLLTMTGHEHFAMRSVVMCFITGILLNFALIPSFGATGAAIANVTTTVAVNALYSWWVYKLLGIWPTAFRFSKPTQS
jgi:O-antigen/teichoic acid export membrane protein